MKQRIFEIITLLLIIYSIVLFNNNSEYITDTEHINTLSESGEEILIKMIYCQSQNYYQVQEGKYIKFSKEDKVIEKGNFEDIYFSAYSNDDKSLVLSLTLALTIFYILSLYYMRQNSPFQKIKDYQLQKNKKSFLQLSKKEREIIINRNPCKECKANSKLKFVEEIHDKEWDITQFYFHCEQCGDNVKIRR